MDGTEVVERLHALADPSQLEGQARYGIDTSASLGIAAPAMRALAKEIGRDHDLALELWEVGLREARIIACLIDDPARVTEGQMEDWAKDFTSWDVVDTCCCNLFDRTPFAYSKAIEWSSREEEFVKRAAFSLIACIAVHHKKVPDSTFDPFLGVIEREACDDRNFVKKAVNWALRQIGKRNLALRDRAIEASRRIQAKGCRAGRWIAADALRELQSEQLEQRLRGQRHP